MTEPRSTVFRLAHPSHRDCGHRHPYRRRLGVELLSLVRGLCRASAFICSTRRCATARRRTASTSRWPTSSRSRAMLDDLGVDYVEGGYPGANPTDTNFFAERRRLRCEIHRVRHDAAAGPLGLERSGACGAASRPRPTPSASSPSPGTITCASRWRPRDEENLASIRDSVRAAKAKGREVLLDCEHFFDGYKANPAYALACAKAAYDEGARWVVLCDTNGGTLPHEVEAIVAEGLQRSPRRSCRHPCPQRYRAGGGQFVCRGARRRAADPGHAQRARRALRQRQSGVASSRR